MPLVLLQDKIIKAFESNRIVVGLYLDLKKAFDTVDHNILLSKIFSYGITGIFFSMIESYLTGRLQCVKYKSKMSSSRTVNIGVPQGSILGPLLFILYINDFPNICKNSSCLLYADDTAIFFEAQTESELQKMIDIDVPKMVDWFNANKLSLNTSKTFCQLYKKSTSLVNINMSLNGENIVFVNKIKYLGVYIDIEMKWRSQIDHVTSIVSRNTGIIKKASFFVSRKYLLLLYNSLFLPYVNYCCLIWGYSSPSLLARLTKIQKKAIRIIDGQPRLAHTNPIFRKLNILKIKDIAVQQTIILLHNVVKQNIPAVIRSMFILNHLNAADVRTRSIKHFQEPFASKMYATQNIFWQGPRLWNLIVASAFPDINSIPVSKEVIKNIIKEQIIGQYHND